MHATVIIMQESTPDDDDDNDSSIEDKIKENKAIFSDVSDVSDDDDMITIPLNLIKPLFRAQIEHSSCQPGLRDS